MSKMRERIFKANPGKDMKISITGGGKKRYTIKIPGCKDVRLLPDKAWRVIRSFYDGDISIQDAEDKLKMTLGPNVAIK